MAAEKLVIRSAETTIVLAEIAAEGEVLRQEFRTGVMGPDSSVPWAAREAKLYAESKAAKKASREKEHADDTYGGKRYF